VVDWVLTPFAPDVDVEALVLEASAITREFVREYGG
jgi:hypothetical protein